MIGVFILLRRRTDAVSVRPMDWAVAASGTALPLMVAAGGKPLMPAAVTLVIMLAGFGLSFWAKLLLRRSFGLVAANRGVKKGGPYGIVRHPMYLGYLIAQVGFLISNPILWNLVVYSTAFLSQLIRIGAEERILMEDAAYRAHALKVRYRLIPGVF
jgi:protein-S-isoprenylcysteine O-methyltransferase Ste14